MTHKLQISTAEPGWDGAQWQAIDANTYDVTGYDELGYPYSNDPVGFGPTEHEAVADLLRQLHDRLDGREFDRAVYFDFCSWLENRWSYREVMVGGPGYAAGQLADQLYIDTFREAPDEELREYSKGA